MGYYIQAPTNKGKAEYLVNSHGGIIVPQPSSFEEIQPNEALVVVVDNGLFEAAGLVYDEREFRDFTDSSDPRPKKFVLLDRELAYKLAGYEHSLK